jgi:hypothetical protein
MATPLPSMWPRGTWWLVKSPRKSEAGCRLQSATAVLWERQQRIVCDQINIPPSHQVSWASLLHTSFPSPIRMCGDWRLYWREPHLAPVVYSYSSDHPLAPNRDCIGHILLYFIYLFIFVGLGFELRALCLQSKHTTT